MSAASGHCTPIGTTSDVDSAQVAALAAVLAESMNIPDDERARLQQPRRASLEAGSEDGNAGTKSVEEQHSAPESPADGAG